MTTSQPSIPTSSTHRLSGFGTQGPNRDRAAYDTVIQAYGGLASNQADPADGVPVFLRQASADKVTALFASQAITAALFARARGRGGQHVQLSMMDAVVSFLWADSAANEVLLESDHSLPSSFVAGSRPFRFSDAWGIVTPTSDRDFAGMCRALGVEGYDDPRVATIVERFKHRHVTAQMMESCYANASGLTSVEASERFEAEGVPYAMILSPDELTHDPHALAVGLFEYQEPPCGRAKSACPGIQPSSPPRRHPWPAVPRPSASTPTRSSRDSGWATASRTCGRPASWNEATALLEHPPAHPSAGKQPSELETREVRAAIGTLVPSSSHAKATRVA